MSNYIYYIIYILNITVLLLVSAFFDLEEHSNEPHHWEGNKSFLLALGSNIFPKLCVMRLGGSNHQLVVTPSSRLKSMTHLLHLRYTFSYRTESDITNFKLCLLRKPLIPREEWGTTDSREGMGDYTFQGENRELHFPGKEWGIIYSRGRMETTYSKGSMGDYTFQGRNGDYTFQGRMGNYTFQGRNEGWNMNNNASEFRTSGKNSGPDLLMWKTSMGICKWSQGPA